jgi:hypothetical protein
VSEEQVEVEEELVEREEVTRKERRKVLPRRGGFGGSRWIDKCKAWGSVIGLLLGSLVYAVPHLYSILRDSEQDMQVQELTRKAREYQVRALEKQLEEMQRKQNQ